MKTLALALMTVAFAATANAQSNAQSHTGRVLEALGSDALARQKCRKGYIWDANSGMCIPRKPRGSF